MIQSSVVRFGLESVARLQSSLGIFGVCVISRIYLYLLYIYISACLVHISGNVGLLFLENFERGFDREKETDLVVWKNEGDERFDLAFERDGFAEEVTTLHAVKDAYRALDSRLEEVWLIKEPIYFDFLFLFLKYLIDFLI